MILALEVCVVYKEVRILTSSLLQNGSPPVRRGIHPHPYKANPLPQDDLFGRELARGDQDNAVPSGIGVINRLLNRGIACNVHNPLALDADRW